MTSVKWLAKSLRTKISFLMYWGKKYLDEGEVWLLIWSQQNFPGAKGRFPLRFCPSSPWYRLVGQCPRLPALTSTLQPWYSSRLTKLCRMPSLRIPSTPHQSLCAWAGRGALEVCRASQGRRFPSGVLSPCIIWDFPELSRRCIHTSSHCSVILMFYLRHHGHRTLRSRVEYVVSALSEGVVRFMT